MERKAEIEDLQGRLENVIAEKEALGLEVDDLKVQLEDLEKVKKQLSRSYGRLNKAKNTIAQYERMLREQEAEIHSLRAQVAQQDTIIKVLKVEKIALQDTISKKQEESVYEKEEKEKGKKLVAKGFKIGIKDSKGRIKYKYDKRQGGYIYKTKDLVKNSYIEFTIAENPIANIESKEVYVQLLDPANTTIYDLQKGGGDFEDTEGNSLFYTSKQDITYNRSAQKLSIDYSRGTKFEKGTHKINVFTDGILIGSGQFIIK